MDLSVHGLKAMRSSLGDGVDRCLLFQLQIRLVDGARAGIDFSFHVHKRSCDDVYTGSCDEHAGSRQDGGIGASVWRAADKQGLVGQKHYLQ